MPESVLVGHRAPRESPHEIREVRFRNERLRPEALLQRGLRQDFRPFDSGHPEEPERLGRQVHLAAVPCQLPRVEIEDEGAEAVMRAIGLTLGLKL
jgi:hypothetical protein